MSKKEMKTDTPRISCKLIDYIKYIQKRYKEEYHVDVEFTQASDILAKRAEEDILFK